MGCRSGGTSPIYKMKYAFLLFCLLGLASCQFRRFRPRFNNFGGQQNNFRGGQQNNFRGGQQADDNFGGKSYHFSWRHDGGQKYTGGGAHSYCSRLGGGWKAVGISSPDEGRYINGIIGNNRQEYIWTGGVKSGRGWRWLTGESFNVNDWSHTGGAQRPQPDNREGDENCLAILNNFYRDGIKWHDVSCHHLKPVICESN
ncbi:hypothetical protein Pmani_015287 [Petrolisthes manimaculis]|uniref:C-type lectin domain-containing protein n=1 Tax=Petrolisthes manimaculis TaxID=1843537 RepID=A0AAE1U7T1_9EUCA|nr:hypothetical protein Pmani_015287 [Petrolisthes manimaculis]